MNITITATQPSLDAKVDPRFGRCPYFLIVDTDTLNFEAVQNPNVMLGGGAGIQSAQLMAERGVKHILTGNCGPNAYQTLSAAGIGVIVGCSGIVADVIEQFKAGQLGDASEANVASKFGVAGVPNPAADQQAGLQQPPITEGAMGMGRGMGGGMGQGGGGGGGMGRGGGRGMGQGGGGGMGRGMGQGQGMRQGGGGMGAGFAQGPVAMPQQPAQPMITKADELAMLKQQAEAMTQQMQQIQERIKRLEE